MRHLALALALLAGPAMAGQWVMQANGNELRLHDEPCTNAETLAKIKPEWHSSFRKASAVIDGKQWRACWIDADGVAVIVYEDGDQAGLPLAGFRQTGT